MLNLIEMDISALNEDRETSRRAQFEAQPSGGTERNGTNRPFQLGAAQAPNKVAQSGLPNGI